MSALVASSGLKDRHSERVKDSTRSERSLSLVVVRDVEELDSYVPAWEKLAADAIEPNVFYEPWMLIPAIRSLGAGRTWVGQRCVASSRSCADAGTKGCLSRF